MINTYKKKFTMKLDSWMLYHQRNCHFKMRYHGLHMQKIPTDLIIYQEIIYDTQPDVIIEIGGAGGGTALWLCHQLDTINKGKMISLDINHGGFKAEHPRLVKVTGDSTLPSTIEALLKEAGSPESCMIIHDGSHKKEDIKKDFESYSKLVSVGSYFIIEDGVMDIFNWKDHRTTGHDCGLFAGIELAKENDNWVIDQEKEKYIITNNPQGFLKRQS